MSNSIQKPHRARRGRTPGKSPVNGDYAPLRIRKPAAGILSPSGRVTSPRVAVQFDYATFYTIRQRALEAGTSFGEQVRQLCRAAIEKGNS